MADKDKNPTGETVPPKDEKPEAKPLPEGFDPKEFGLPTPEEWQASQTLVAERDDWRKRAEDNQRAFHANQTLFAQRFADMDRKQEELARELRERTVFTGHTSATPSSQDLLMKYQQSQNPADYFAYQDARTQEIVNESLKRLEQRLPASAATQPQVDPYLLEQRLRYMQTKDHEEIPIEELETAFTPNAGGSLPTYPEASIVLRARKAGGWEKLKESIAKKAVEDFKAGIEGKKGKGVLPEIPERTAVEPGEPDLEQMSDRDVVAKYGNEEAKARLQEIEGGKI